MTDINMEEYFDKNWRESQEKEERIKAKIKPLQTKLNSLKKKKDEKTDEFEKKQSEFRNQAVDRLEEKIRHERKNGSKSLGTAIEDDATIKAVLDEMEANRKEYEAFCNETDAKIKSIEDPLKKLYDKLSEQRKITRDNYDEWESVFFRVYGGGNSSESYSNRMQESSSSNDAAEYEEVLKRDREARWKHEEEERRREERRLWDEKKRQEAQERTAHRKQVWDEINARKERERNLRHQCNTCSLASKCYMRGSFPCPTYRPR